MNVFAEKSYKNVIIKKVDELKSKNLRKVTFQEVANAGRIQKTYLSKVLNHDAQLTDDQLFLICEYLELNTAERQFVLDLKGFEMSNLPQRRKELQKRISAAQAEHLRTEKFTQVNDGVLSEQDKTEYYLDPNFSIVHMLLTIKELSQRPAEISNILRIPSEKLEKYLKRLEQMRVIRFEKNRYVVLQNDIHLPAESHLQSSYRTSMRLRAIEKMASQPSEDFYSFSVVFSSDDIVRKNIQEKFLAFLNSVQQLVSEGSEKEVYQINFDLLNWT